MLRIVPGPFVLWVGKWLDLFSRSNLTYPGWQSEAQNTALALGAVAAILTGLIFGKATQSRLRMLTIVGTVITFIFIASCWLIWHLLGKGMPPSQAKSLQDLWEGVYIASMVLLVVTITMGALSLGQTKRKMTWIMVSLIVFAILLIGAYFVLFRGFTTIHLFSAKW